MSTFTIKTARARSWLLGLAGLVLLGCGPQFDPPSRLQSLRILAVKKDDPYLRPAAPPEVSADSFGGVHQPDNVASMTLAMQDARLADLKQGPLQKIWFAGCNNPPRDHYFSCLLNVWVSFKALTELGPGPGGLGSGQSWSLNDVVDANGQRDNARLTEFVLNTFPEAAQSATGSGDPTLAGQGTSIDDLIDQAFAIKVGAGDTFDYQVPAWSIDKHDPPAQPTLPRYGLSDVFVAVCDGELGFSPEWEKDVDPLAVLTDATRGFPLTCYERGTKNERGPDNFMVSYSSLYVYENLTNQNPIIRGFTFDGKPVDSSAFCLGADCLVASEPSCAAESAAPRVKLCQPNSSSGCREYDVSPILLESENSELDDIASRVGGGNSRLLEQMWLRYYADQGEIANDAKRLQDATEGWFAEHKTKWTAPTKGAGASEPEGVAHIWSVAYDNRGGVDWVRVSVCIDS